MKHITLFILLLTFSLPLAALPLMEWDISYIECLKNSLKGKHNFSADEVRSLCEEISGTHHIYENISNIEEGKSRIIELPPFAVDITIIYSAKEKCSESVPLFVTIFNPNDKTLKRVSFYLQAFRKGYSKDHLSTLTKKYYIQYKILSSGQAFSYCTTLATLPGNTNPKDFIYSAKNIKATFYPASITAEEFFGSGSDTHD